MKYIIESPKLGVVGEEFVPPEGVNIDALLEGGFISTAKTPKSSKVKTDNEEN